MKYLNNNIEALAKKSTGKSLVNHTTSCGIFQNCDYNSSLVKDYLQSSRINIS